MFTAHELNLIAKVAICKHTEAGRSPGRHKRLSLGHCGGVPGAILHVAVTGAALQFHGVDGQTVGGGHTPGALGVKSLIFWGEPMKQYHPTPRPLGLGGGGKYGIQEPGRGGKERGQAREGTAVHLTDRQAGTGSTHAHAGTHTLLLLRVPSDTLFHRAPESTKSHEPGLKS